jgi:hypothetical protein
LRSGILGVNAAQNAFSSFPPEPAQLPFGILDFKVTCYAGSITVAYLGLPLKRPAGYPRLPTFGQAPCANERVEFRSGYFVRHKRLDYSPRIDAIPLKTGFAAHQ